MPTPLPAWGQPSPGASPGSGRLIAAVVALAVVSLLALGVAAAAWFRSSPRTAADKPVYSEQQQTSAREAVCTATDSVKSALTAATHQPEAKESGNQLLIAINIRLAEYAGADYLSQQLAANPAAPQSVADPAGGLVASLRRLAIGQLSDAPAESLQHITTEIGSLTDQITKACAGHT
jgi:hypothetical protein